MDREGRVKGARAGNEAPGRGPDPDLKPYFHPPGNREIPEGDALIWPQDAVLIYICPSVGTSTYPRTIEEGDWMAIFRTRYYGEVNVGVGGRITIPQDMRDDLGIEEGDILTVRVEENSSGTRQMVMWRSEQQAEE
jgi:AbrB family looped-hinge helix DNA binding protein